MAQLITGADDLVQLLNLEQCTEKRTLQARLFQQLTGEEHFIAGLLQCSEPMHIDELKLKSKFDNSRLACLLLNMELNGFLKSLPGKRYRLS